MSKDLVRRSRLTATIVGVPQCERRSSQWDELRLSDSAELATSLLKFESWLEQQGEKS